MLGGDGNPKSFYVLFCHIPHVYPSSLLNLARLCTEKFLVLPTKSWNDTNTCSDFP